MRNDIILRPLARRSVLVAPFGLTAQGRIGIATGLGAAAARLAMAVQPSSTLQVGGLIAIEPEVELRNISGGLVQTANKQITAAYLASGVVTPYNVLTAGAPTGTVAKPFAAWEITSQQVYVDFPWWNAGQASGMSPSNCRSILDGYAAAGRKCFVRLWTDAQSAVNGVFNLAAWKTSVDRYKNAGLQSYLEGRAADGTIIYHMLMDDITSTARWGPNGITMQNLADIAAYCFQEYPVMGRWVRARGSQLQTLPTGHKLEGCISQYRFKFGGINQRPSGATDQEWRIADVIQYTNQEIASCANLGILLTLAVNFSGGGDGSSGVVYGTGTSGQDLYFVGGQEIVDYATVMVPVSHRWFQGWKFGGDTQDRAFYNRTEVRAGYNAVRTLCDNQASGGSGGVQGRAKFTGLIYRGGPGTHQFIFHDEAGEYVDVLSNPVVIGVGPMSPAHCTAARDQIGSRVGQAVNLSVQLRDASGNVVNNSTATVRAVLTGALSQTLTLVHVSNGLYRVSYTPSTIGTITAAITVNGTNIVNTPMVHTVFPTVTPLLTFAPHSTAIVPASVVSGQPLNITVVSNNLDGLPTTQVTGTPSGFIIGSRRLVHSPLFMTGAGITAPYNTYWDGGAFVPLTGQAGLVGQLDLLRARGQCCILRLPGSVGQWTTSVSGTTARAVDMTQWKTNVDRWPSGSYLDEYIADGTVLGVWLADDPHDLLIYNIPLTAAQINAMGDYIHQKFPYMPCFVRADHVQMNRVGGNIIPEVVNMWAHWTGPYDDSRGHTPASFMADRIASLYSGKGLLMGNDISTGGTGASGLPFPGTTRFYQSGAEIAASANVFLDGSDPVLASLDWKFDPAEPADVTHLSNATVRSSLLAAMTAASKPKQIMTLTGQVDNTWTFQVTPVGAGMRTIYISIDGRLINYGRPYRVRVT